MTEGTGFSGGVNIAMKIPPHLFDATEAFYTETLGLTVVERRDSSVGLRFGPNRLWLDKVDTLRQTEIWLEVEVNDVSAAENRLALAGVVRCDTIEPLPDGYPGFWITSPANIVHLVVRRPEPNERQSKADPRGIAD